MAIVLEANYAKKLGLPGYSSHQYAVSIRTELTDLAQAGPESDRLYLLLQEAVDRSLQHTGFLPAAASPTSTPTNPHPNSNGAIMPDSWRCSDKQRELIEKLQGEHDLDSAEIEDLALDLFGVPPCRLDRLQASGLIDELFERYGSSGGSSSSRRSRSRSNGNGNGNGHGPASSAQRPDLGGLATQVRRVSSNGGAHRQHPHHGGGHAA